MGVVKFILQNLYFQFVTSTNYFHCYTIIKVEKANLMFKYNQPYKRKVWLDYFH